MALRIAHNIPAMTTQRWLGISDAGLTKSLERLSSGYRINRAADDAAGLAISESFRANIASFKVASRNASEASSLLQVAEGAMDQIGNMLTRLKELATQASSANAGSSEREKIDAEAEQLKTEIERIANVTKYGSTSLLDGTFGASNASAMGAGTSADGIIGSTYNTYDKTVTSGQAAPAAVWSAASWDAIGSTVAEGIWKIKEDANGDLVIAKITGTSATGSALVEETSTAAISAAGTITFANLAITITITGSMTGATRVATALTEWSDLDAIVTFKRTGLTSLAVENADTGTYTFDKNAAANRITLGDGTTTQTIDYTSGGPTHTFADLNISFYLGSDYGDSDLEGMTITVSSTGSSGSTFQIGSENSSDNRVAISIDSVKVAALSLTDLDLGATANAQIALDLVDDAISTLTGSRGTIGAYMNRLLYASANLATTIENVQAAESVIPDVDMANEMTSFTKNQILLQAGTAMLAQANMAPQQVLALFG